MSKIAKTKIAAGIYWLEVPEAGLYVLCGCPADSVKHLMKAGKICTIERESENCDIDSQKSPQTVSCENGPNAILLSDLGIQNGHFANLAEFPVLQMLYRQGMLLPNHPNNTGAKPLLIGREEVVRAQMDYIYRGNYGLGTLQEILETGVPQVQAEEMMRLKLRFAFGKIHPSSDLLEAIIVDHREVEVLNGVCVARRGVNRYEFSYQDERVEVVLNLEKNENYDPPYELENHHFKREYFSVVHTGEGDGWDINRPCMAGVLSFQGKVYLIDAGPNIAHSLNAIGVDVNEVEGIFHTHAHDDHFAGLTTLIRTNHRIKYFSTRLVRASVTKKLASLMSIEEKTFEEYFEVHDLEFDQWNNINGLEVRPLFSPHPVETNILFFRALGEEGYATYAHLADVASFEVLDGMLTENLQEPGINKKLLDQVKQNYLTPVKTKKIDIGGGLIHGMAKDFRDDQSDKIILSHTALKLTVEEKAIGSGVSFGSTEVLIEGHEDYALEFGANYLRGYYPSVDESELHMLLNCERVFVGAGTILLKDQEIPNYVNLVLTGVAELISVRTKAGHQLSSGSLIGDMPVLFGFNNNGTYRALSNIEILKIPATLFKEFVSRNQLLEELQQIQETIEFLQQTWLFAESISSPIQSKIAQNMTLTKYEAGEQIKCGGLVLVKFGFVELSKQGGEAEAQSIMEGDFWGGEDVIYRKTKNCIAKAKTPTEIYRITDLEFLQQIPIVRWKMLEHTAKRERQEDGKNK